MEVCGHLVQLGDVRAVDADEALEVWLEVFALCREVSVDGLDSGSEASEVTEESEGDCWLPHVTLAD